MPLATYVRKYSNMKFEPAGITDDPDLRIATSLVDYIFRRLALDYLPYEERVELGVLSTSERIQPTLPGVEESATPSVGMVDDGHRGRAGDDRGDPSQPPCRHRRCRRYARPSRAARRAVLLQLRQRHAAGRVLLRLRELRLDQRLLVVPTALVSAARRLPHSAIRRRD